MAEYKIVVISPDGKVVAVQPYDYTNDGNRDQRAAAAMKLAGDKIGVVPPNNIIRSRSITDQHGNVWGKMSCHIDVGMVETSPGVWGFDK